MRASLWNLGMRRTDTHLYINLRRARDGTRLFGLCVSDPRFIQFALASGYAVHIIALSI